MASPADPASRLALGAAAYLADRDLVTFDDAYDYAAGDRFPAFQGPEMPAEVDELAVFTVRLAPIVRRTRLADLQIRLRGRENGGSGEILERLAEIEQAFTPNGYPLVHALLGDIRIGAIYAADMLPLAADARRRAGALQNYRVRFRP